MALRSATKAKRLAIALLIASGCTTLQNGSVGPLPQLPPEYVQVPHPDGLDRADLTAIFTDLQAPSPEQLSRCDADFMLLRARTTSKDEQLMGARELVRRDPVSYHWCFYGKLLELDDKLRDSVYLDEKQKSVLKTYLFLTPIARAFIHEYADTRYMRWAVHRYKRLSEYVFYRRLDLTPRAAEELATASNPFGAVRPNKATGSSVLTKYGIIRPEDTVTAPLGGPGDSPPLQTEGSQPVETADAWNDPASPTLTDPLDANATASTEATQPSSAARNTGSQAPIILQSRGRHALPDPVPQERMPASLPDPVTAELQTPSKNSPRVPERYEGSIGSSSILDGDRLINNSEN